MILWDLSGFLTHKYILNCFVVHFLKYFILSSCIYVLNYIFVHLIKFISGQLFMNNLTIIKSLHFINSSCSLVGGASTPLGVHPDSCCALVIQVTWIPIVRWTVCPSPIRGNKSCPPPSRCFIVITLRSIAYVRPATIILHRKS